MMESLLTKEVKDEPWDEKEVNITENSKDDESVAEADEDCSDSEVEPAVDDVFNRRWWTCRTARNTI